MAVIVVSLRALRKWRKSAGEGGGRGLERERERDGRWGGAVCFMGKIFSNATTWSETQLWDLQEEEDTQLCRYDVTRSSYFSMNARQGEDNMTAICPRTPIGSQ